MNNMILQHDEHMISKREKRGFKGQAERYEL